METPCGIFLREFFCDYWYVSRSKFERVGGPRIIFIICNHTQSLIAILFKIKFYDFFTLGYIKKCKKKIKNIAEKKNFGLQTCSTVPVLHSTPLSWDENKICRKYERYGGLNVKIKNPNISIFTAKKGVWKTYITSSSHTPADTLIILYIFASSGAIVRNLYLTRQSRSHRCLHYNIPRNTPR